MTKEEDTKPNSGEINRINESIKPKGNILTVKSSPLSRVSSCMSIISAEKNEALSVKEKPLADCEQITLNEEEQSLDLGKYYHYASVK